MRHRLYATALLSILLTTSALSQDDTAGNEWPREIQIDAGTVVVYQPQPEALNGNVLDARAAVSVDLQSSDGPVFGAVWFQGRLETDRADRVAIIDDISVTQVRFPGEQSDDDVASFSTLLETEMAEWEPSISMDRLLTSLEMTEQRIQAAERINTDPPVILFEDEPAILVTIDGEPRLTQEQGTELMRVINTPYTLLLDSQSGTYYLNADVSTWYSASNIEGEWTVAGTVPVDVANLAPEPDDLEAEGVEDDTVEAGPPPKIIIATEPTELISASAGAEYTPIADMDLLYMSNTESDLFLHIATQQNYLLAAGRWYAAASVEGPWSYVPGDELPEDFTRIPEDHQMSNVLYAVPGTNPATEALLDAQIPQTATVQRDSTTLQVEYDGEPEFRDIADTAMTYAVNSPSSVIYAEGYYYACDEAVWFASSSPTGPWTVATEIPQVIYTIPPDSPIYNVTHVHVYNSTPEVVYVGYTSGYTGTYIYGPTIVYGTGFWYPYWYGRYYYPRPTTFGFHVRYNPWYGWSFGLSYSTGPFTFYVGRGGWYGGGWWGPAHYRGYRHGYHHGYRRGYYAGYAAGQRNAARANLYNTPQNRARGIATADRATAANRVRPAAANNLSNNVFTDRDGNVFRNTADGWQQRTNQSWQNGLPADMPTSRPSAQPTLPTARPSTPTTLPTNRPSTLPTTRPSTQPALPATRPSSFPSSSGRNPSSLSNMNTSQQLNMSQNARQRGSQRTNNFNTSRAPAGASRAGAGARPAPRR